MDALGIATILVGVVAAGAAIWLAILTRGLVLTSQEQVRVSQRQVEQSLEAEYDAQRPVLIPITPLLSLGYGSTGPTGNYTQPSVNGYDSSQPFAGVIVHNGGPGIALNICGILYGQEPRYPKQGDLDDHFDIRYLNPLMPGGDVTQPQWKLSNFNGLLVSPWTELRAKDERHKLYAPLPPDENERKRGQTERVARLTLTYADIFGRKHAAIFDFTVEQVWENVAYLRNIPEDLADLDAVHRKSMVLYEAPTPTRIES